MKTVGLCFTLLAILVLRSPSLESSPHEDSPAAAQEITVDASAPAHFARRYLQLCHNLHHIQPVYFRKWAEGMHAARGTDGEYLPEPARWWRVTPHRALACSDPSSRGARAALGQNKKPRRPVVVMRV